MTVATGESTRVALYVYGVVDAVAAAPAAAGVEGDVSAIPAGDVAALVSRVPLAEYDEEPVRAHLEDAAWLEEKARLHEAVLESALATGPVVPFRFLTLYRADDDLHRFLDVEGARLRALLEALRGKVELGVKAFVDRERLDETIARRTPAVAELDEALASASSGTAYLLQRRRDRALDEACNAFRHATAEDVHARLAAHAEAATASPVRGAHMLLNGAYLVRAGDGAFEAELARVQDELAPVGVTFELTGPWPAYNFVPRELGER